MLGDPVGIRASGVASLRCRGASGSRSFAFPRIWLIQFEQMTEPSPDRSAALVGLLRLELDKHMDLPATIASFGQVEASCRRDRGEVFTMRDHVRGMVLSLLSSNRPWRPIADNISKLTEVFADFDPDVLAASDPAKLVQRVKDLRCGNQRITYQMRAIGPNLETFRRVEAEAGLLDDFVDQHSVDHLAKTFGMGTRFKLKEMGPPLVMEYLKNVGRRTAKPDVHVLRICGPDRLGILSRGATPIQAAQEFAAFADVAGVHVVELDNMIWLLGAKDYAEICAATPQCGRCSLRAVCRQGRG